MIYTVTLNPALDYIIKVPDFTIGQINRCDNERMVCGGKGINVSIILSELGVKNVCTGIFAGFTGEEIIRQLKESGMTVQSQMVKEGMSRINLKVLGKEETQLNGSGPNISREEFNQFLQLIKQTIKQGDYLILAGSIPACLPENTYEIMIKSLLDKSVRFVVDTTKTSLLDTLKYHPFLIKPNQEELEALFHTKVRTREEVLFYAKKLQEMGAINVLISMGEQGAILLDENQMVHDQKAAPGIPVNTVGAGDSMIGGFLAGYMMTRDYKEALLYGTAAGSATAFSYELAKREDIISLYEKLKMCV